MSVEVRSVVVMPPDFYDRYRRARLKERDVLIARVRSIEEEFDIEPKRRALCPQCRREWNEKAG